MPLTDITSRRVHTPPDYEKKQFARTRGCDSQRQGSARPSQPVNSDMTRYPREVNQRAYIVFFARYARQPPVH